MRTFRLLFLPGMIFVSACGSSGSTQSGSDAGNSGGCAAGETFCSACSGGGFCSSTCPAITCPTSTDAGGGPETGGGGDSGVGDDSGAGCQGSTSTTCVDCSGNSFCVSGSCPSIACPTDAGSSGGSDAAASCPSSSPSVGQSCTQAQGCTYMTVCVYCASSTHTGMPAECSMSTDACRWSSKSVANDSSCPSTPPTKGAQCPRSLQCDYCLASGLLEASCSIGADTYTWSLGYVAAQ